MSASPEKEAGPTAPIRVTRSLSLDGSLASPTASTPGFPRATTPIDTPGGEWRARHALYCSHFLSAWGERMWEFAVGLIMLEANPRSLLLVSVFGLVDGAMQALLGASVGSYVGRSTRLRAACSMYILQNSAVAVSALSSFALLRVEVHGVAFWSLVCTTIVSGAISSLGSLGSTLAVEREWTKAMAHGDSEALASVNAGMRRIDLTCLVASPILVGFLMTYGSVSRAAAFIMLWNILACGPECLLLGYSQTQLSVLRAEKAWQVVDTTGTAFRTPESFLATTLSAWATYLRQRAMPAALSLAMLYLTVLSFGLLMTAYLKWKGMTEATLSIFRGLGALSGLSSTFVFPQMHKFSGLLTTGMRGIWLQFIALAGAAVPALLAYLRWPIANVVVTYAVVSGVVLSRFGLWLFDLAVNQLLQEWVLDEELGVVMGVQGSLQSFFQTTAYAAGIVVWQPERFAVLMTGSFLTVGMAALIYTTFAMVAIKRGESQQPYMGIPDPEDGDPFAADTRSEQSD